MGVRIQELPETTGIKKEDVLIIEDGQGTKKGTVQQLDEALGVSQLKEDLADIKNDVYHSTIGELDVPTGVTKTYVGSDGLTHVNSSSSITGFISVVPNTKVTLVGVYLQSIRCLCAYRSANYNDFIGVISSGISDTTITFDVPADCNYVVATTTLNGTVSGSFEIQGNKIEEIENEISEIKNKPFDFMKMVDRNVHLSIDDVAYALYRLQTENPSSIYDIDFFATLKTIHDTYGVCITCNTFNYLSSVSDYDISNTPNTWYSEFQEAKDWLRFSFHAKNDKTYAENVTTSDVDYAKFVNAIISFTGTSDCIDRVARLGFFSGSITEVSKMKNSDNGVIALLCSDDDRDSYYLSEIENNEVQKKGLYFDKQNGLYFVRTLPRLDTKDVEYIKSYMRCDSRANKIVELFCHEPVGSSDLGSGAKGRINNVLNVLVNERGYGSAFIMDLIN